MPNRTVADSQDQVEQYPINDNSGGVFLICCRLSGLFRGKEVLMLLIIAGLFYFFPGRVGCNMCGGGIAAVIS